MRSLQDQAIDVLTALSQGDWSDLSANKRRIVANWAAMFTVSYEFADKETVKIPVEERLRFSKDQSLGDDWLVAIGVADFPSPDSASHRAMSSVMSDGTRKPVQLTAWDFGELLLVTAYGPDVTLSKIAERVFWANLRTIHPERSAQPTKPKPVMAKQPHDVIEFITPRNDARAPMFSVSLSR
jgi:hypothetical protein